MTKILLIEDNVANRTLTDRVLRPFGYELFHAADGESGIQMAVEETPEMVLIDIGLPDIDGHTVVTLLKQVAELQETVFVALTAWPQELAADIIQRYGYNGIITKPIDVKLFPEQIAAFLQD